MKTKVLKWVGILAVLASAPLTQAQDAWIVGQSAPLTGSNAAFGKDIRDGALAWFKSVNARGGVGGKPIELVTLDDANDRKTAGANTQKLLTANGAIFTVQGKAIAETVCIACHGADGNSAAAANPHLAQQGEEYIYKQLKNFKAVDGKPAARNNAIIDRKSVV